jgi:predicted ATPase
MRNHQIQKLCARNFRSLASLEMKLGAINVVFGPNGVGKSSLLDTLWFLRDCAVRGVEQASSARDHGIGLLWDGAPDDANIEVQIHTALAQYTLSVGLSGGRIEPRAAETLIAQNSSTPLILRLSGSDKLAIANPRLEKDISGAELVLREPERLGVESYLLLNPGVAEVQSIDQALRVTKFFASRAFALSGLKRRGSETGNEQWLWDRGENAWSVLRNLRDRERIDNRWAKIRNYMKEAFPTFEDILFDQAGPRVVNASFFEKGLRKPIYASGVSDGHLSFLLLLTAIFGELATRGSILLLDEPDLSLHPWALAVLAKAIKEAAEHWDKQFVIATHSPVLLSQFEVEDCFALSKDEHGTHLTRVSEMSDVGPILQAYALGSLYMAEAIAPQREPATGAS